MRKSVMQQAIRDFEEGKRLDPQSEKEVDRDAVWAEDLDKQLRAVVVGFLRTHPEGQNSVLPALMSATVTFAQMMGMSTEDFTDFARAVINAEERATAVNRS